MMCSCWYRWRHRCCDCSLKTFGFLYGWMGVIWRTIFTMFLAVTLSRTTHYDPNIYDIVLITALSYIQLSLATNLFFLIGIQKEKPYFMLPYTVIGGLELFFGVVIFIYGTVFMSRTRFTYLLSIFIPIIISVLAIYLFFWIKTIQLYRQMDVEIRRKREEDARVASIRQSLAH